MDEDTKDRILTSLRNAHLELVTLESRLPDKFDDPANAHGAFQRALQSVESALSLLDPEFVRSPDPDDEDDFEYGGEG